MAGISESDLEERLAESGRIILETLPRTKEDLIRVLEEVEKYLSLVEQSPSKAIEEATLPSMRALVKSHLLKHQDEEVRLLVIACISEITRITAPEAPYDDNLMREIFGLIVESFKGLNLPSNDSFGRRTTILETVAKVRSCVVMLDLECDDLIVEMFKHFFDTVRSTVPNVRASMATIMQLVVEESEEIQQQLLFVLLNNLRHDKRETSPDSYNLAVEVVEACAAKLKPYLLSEMSADGLSLSDLKKEYHDVIYDICRGAEVVPGYTSREDQPDKCAPEPAVENDSVHKSLAAASSAVEKTSQGDIEMTNEEKHVTNGKVLKLSVDNNLHKDGDNEHNELIKDQQVKEPAKEVELQDVMPTQGLGKPNKGKRSNQSRRSAATAKVELEKSVDLKTEETDKPNVPSREGWKALNKCDSENNKNHGEILTGGVVESSPAGRRKRGQSKESKSSVSHPEMKKEVSETTPEDSLLQATETKPEENIGLPDELDVDEVKISAQVLNGNDDQPSISDNKSENEATESLVPTNEAFSSSQGQSNKEEVDPSENSSKVDAIDGDKTEKPVIASTRTKKGRSKNSGKKDAKTDKALANSDVHLADHSTEVTTKTQTIPSRSPRGKQKEESDKKTSEENMTKRTRRSVGNTTQNNTERNGVKGGKQLTPSSKGNKAADQNTKKMEENAVTEKDANKTPVNNKRTPRSSAKSVSGQEKVLEPGKGKPLDESIVGRKVKVWWPHDKQYYVGVVDSYVASAKKHKIVYDDGDVEVLNLERQKWSFADDASVSQKTSTENTPASDKQKGRPSKKEHSGTSNQNTVESSAKVAAGSSKGRRKTKIQSDGNVDGNGSTKNIIRETAGNDQSDGIMSDAEETSSPVKSARNKDEAATKKRKRTSNKRTNGSVKKQRAGRGKRSSMLEKLNNASDGDEGNSDDEPMEH